MQTGMKPAAGKDFSQQSNEMKAAFGLHAVSWTIFSEFTGKPSFFVCPTVV